MYNGRFQWKDEEAPRRWGINEDGSFWMCPSAGLDFFNYTYWSDENCFDAEYLFKKQKFDAEVYSIGIDECKELIEELPFGGNCSAMSLLSATGGLNGGKKKLGICKGGASHTGKHLNNNLSSASTMKQMKSLDLDTVKRTKILVIEATIQLQGMRPVNSGRINRRNSNLGVEGDLDDNDDEERELKEQMERIKREQLGHSKDFGGLFVHGDQGGLIIYYNSNHWMKVSLEMGWNDKPVGLNVCISRDGHCDHNIYPWSDDFRPVNADAIFNPHYYQSNDHEVDDDQNKDSFLSDGNTDDRKCHFATLRIEKRLFDYRIQAYNYKKGCFQEIRLAHFAKPSKVSSSMSSFHENDDESNEEDNNRDILYVGPYGCSPYTHPDDEDSAGVDFKVKAHDFEITWS